MGVEELDGNVKMMEYFGVLFRKCRVNLCKDVVKFDFTILLIIFELIDKSLVTQCRYRENDFFFLLVFSSAFCGESCFPGNGGWGGYPSFIGK